MCEYSGIINHQDKEWQSYKKNSEARIGIKYKYQKKKFTLSFHAV